MDVFTLGHSSHSPERFLELLRAHGVAVVADVRSAPYSRYAPHFNKDRLEAALKPLGLEYLYFGRELGGRPEEAEFYDPAGRTLYGRMAASATFRRGLERLGEVLARGLGTALLCGEGRPEQCHRHLLLGRELHRRGVRVRHILPDGGLLDEAELLRREGPQYVQGNLLILNREKQ